MRMYFIRHGATKANKEKRYAGITDENLLPESVDAISRMNAPEVKKIYISPMKRCVQTAEALYPDRDYTVIEGLRECNFGRFENKNHEELQNDKAYIEFIRSEGKSDIPGGESLDVFSIRCTSAFEHIIQDIDSSKLYGDVAVVAHGGTIMALFDAYSFPHKDYYSWMCRNAEGFSADLVIDDGNIRFENTEELKLCRKDS